MQSCCLLSRCLAAFALRHVAVHQLLCMTGPCLCCLQKQQALLGQMLAEGYGCEPNAATSKIWIDKARKRGYRLAGV